jgi:hypothetical protein
MELADYKIAIFQAWADFIERMKGKGQLSIQ